MEIISLTSQSIFMINSIKNQKEKFISLFICYSFLSIFNGFIDPKKKTNCSNDLIDNIIDEIEINYLNHLKWLFASRNAAEAEPHDNS